MDPIFVLTDDLIRQAVLKNAAKNPYRGLFATSRKVLHPDGQTVLIYRDGKLVDEEPVEAHASGTYEITGKIHEAKEPVDLGQCPCGRSVIGCDYHDPSLQQTQA